VVELTDQEVEARLAEYERAQEVALHTDGIVHEITSIVWAANTLLLGFSLDVGCDSKQMLVIFASVAAIVMTLYAPFSIQHIKVIQGLAYGVCREIEKIKKDEKLILPNQLHTKIDDAHSKSKPGQKAVWIVNVVFIWLG
jgi:hypothetical protein